MKLKMHTFKFLVKLHDIFHLKAFDHNKEKVAFSKSTMTWIIKLNGTILHSLHIVWCHF